MKRLIVVLVVLTFVLLGFSLVAGAQTTQDKPADKAAQASVAHPVDINTATKEQLEQIPGLGNYADKIIEGRPYKAKNELVNRNIIPMTLYDQVKNRIVVHRGKKAEVAKAESEPEKEKVEAASREHPLDINTASKEDLEKIPGLGNYADKIIAGRPYKSKGDLVSRQIVPMSVYDRAKDRIVAHAPAAKE